MTSDESYTNGVSSTNADQAFRKINKNSIIFLIWKIENMNLISIPREQYGIFYDSDSYIIFATSIYGQPVGVDTVSREVKGVQLEYHIHFWLGTQTTPDKSGVAAYKTVELDAYLNNITVQYRETQGNESKRFKSYFKNGIRIFKSNITQKLPKLYKIKGKRTPVLTQIDQISWDKFNSNGIYLLHTQKVLFVWMGRAVNVTEKLHATKIAIDMKDEYKTPNGIVFLDDGYEKTLQDEDKKEFIKYLSLDKRQILPENKDDNVISINQRAFTKLYKCTENNGKYRVVEVKIGPLLQSDLEPDDVFIIDQEINGIYVWVGKRANEKEKAEALRNARGFVKKKKYPNNTKVMRVVDGYESNEFKMLFALWKDENKNAKPTVSLSKFDAVTMEERPNLSAETQLIDDGSGNVTLWRIKQNNIIEIPSERHGIFFSGDCYIILYSYQTTTEQKHLLYYWLGSHANQDEITTAAMKTGEIDKELEGLGFQARIIQGKEPPHFLQIFKGKLTIFKGKGVDYDESGRNMKHPSQYLLQIFGSSHSSSKAIQVQSRASVLNSNYCFVFRKGKQGLVWCGNYSTGDQRELAKGFAGKHFEMILEGKEKNEFFEYLGGKTTYITQLKRNNYDPRPARLFQCSRCCKNYNIDEVIFFTQNDLIPEDLILVDNFNCIYIWIGNLSSREDQKQSFQLAIDYLQNDPCGRDLNIPIIQINQGREPPTFTGFFPKWDSDFWTKYKSFGKVRQEIEQIHSTNPIKNGTYEFDIKSPSNFDQYDKYPIEILKEPNEKLPAKVNPLNKELHLTHDDFISIIKMPFVEFEKLPRWKQQELKKKVGLF